MTDASVGSVGLKILLFGWGRAATTCLEGLFEVLPENTSVWVVSHSKQDEKYRLDTTLEKLVAFKLGKNGNGSLKAMMNCISIVSIGKDDGGVANGTSSVTTNGTIHANNDTASKPDGKPDGRGPVSDTTGTADTPINQARGINNKVTSEVKLEYGLMKGSEAESTYGTDEVVSSRYFDSVNTDSVYSKDGKNFSKTSDRFEPSSKYASHLFPDSVGPDKHDIVQNYKPDLIVSVSYRKRLICLDLAKVGSINFHPSILPKHRGCFSGFHTIIDGDTESGVTCHHMLMKFDAGKIIHVEKIPLKGNETSATLYDMLIPVTKKCFQVVLGRFLKTGTLPEGDTQPTEGASYHNRKLPYQGIIQKEWSDVFIERFIRAMQFPPLEGAIYNSIDEDGNTVKHVCDTMDDYLNAVGRS